MGDAAGLGGGAAPVRGRAAGRPAAPALATVALLARRRGSPSGATSARDCWRSHDSAAPRLALLSSPTALALRTQRGGLLAWLIGVGVFAAIIGRRLRQRRLRLSQSVQDLLAKLGTAATTPSGYLGFIFQYLLLALCLFACFELAAMREDEVEQRLETLFALPVSRPRWFAQRLALAAGAALALALAAGLLAWAGAVSQGADVAFGRMLEAGANCLPVVVLFLGLGGLAVALFPRGGRRSRTPSSASPSCGRRSEG